MAVARAEVVVVGAGLAGLSAARELRRRGKEVVVLEARERVGGRTWTRRIGGGSFDVGGQWTGPGQPRMTALIEELGLATAPTFAEGRKVLDLRGRISTYSGTIPFVAPWTLLRLQLALWRFEAMGRTLSPDTPWTAPSAPAWDGTTVGAWLDAHGAGGDARALVNAAARVIFGSEVDELSLLHFLFYARSGGGLMKLIETHGGNQDRAVVGGAQQLCERLAEQLGGVELSCPVRRIEQDARGVTVHGERGAWQAERVVVAVPLPLADRLVYAPALPTLRDQLTQRVGMGATVKCIALYDRPFWRERGLSGESAATDDPVGVSFDNVSAEGQASLVGFVVGRPARGWSERPPEERRAAVLEALARRFGDEARSPTGYDETDWAAEPWSGGAPIATFPPGTLATFGPALRAPVGRIHWAGTETARESTGFMEGALESGLRAASEIP